MSTLLFAITSSFLFAILLFAIGQKNFQRISWFASILPVSLFVYFLGFLPYTSDGQVFRYMTEWVPSLGVNFEFQMDGLSSLFTLLITGIGSLVFLYTMKYMKGHQHLLRFYCYLSIFMGAMLGLVTADNLITLFIFWELTSISSFFLINFKNTERTSRKSAIVALSITGFGGLSLLAFAVLAGSITGTFTISEMLSSSEALNQHPYTPLLLILLFLAAFTKSAQFPFHFWLPGAMKAPTPVSTYLHSATMVKAGIYLLLRFSPHFAENEHFHLTLMIVGAITMLFAGFHTLFRTDLKGVLAYSTIGALGIIIFLIGIGSTVALTAAIVFIIVHALYKAALFLITGTIDHQTGTRDITALGGLKKHFPLLFIAGLLAAISSAGIPPSIGFLGKDLIYESTLHTSNAELWTTIAIITNIFMVFAGFIVGVKPFTGGQTEHTKEVAKPHPIMWVTPLLLAITGIIFGVFAGISESLFTNSITEQLAGAPGPHLKLWHGFTLILLLSAITIGVGLLIYFLWKPSHKKERKMGALDILAPKQLLLTGANYFDHFSLFLTRLFQNGYLRRYVMILLVLLTIVFGYHVFVNPRIFLSIKDIKGVEIPEIIVCVVMFAAILYTAFTRSRLSAIAGMGVLGYAICFIFMFYGAPDLAMTQFSIDTLTVILFVLVLYRLPKYLRLSNNTNRIRDGVIAMTFGTFLAFTIIEVMNEAPVKQITHYYAENAYEMAKGKNIVNVILVDFRGFDTMIEIVVLSIAALGVFALLKLYLKKHEK